MKRVLALLLAAIFIIPTVATAATVKLGFINAITGPEAPIGENLTNLGELPDRVEAMAMPLPIAGADGSPARVLVRQLS